MILRYLPHPYLSAMLLVIWLSLTAFSLGNFVLGLAIGLTIPNLTRAYWPESRAVLKPFSFAVFVLIVLWDIIVANFSVARKVLFWRNTELRPCWISIPLEITTPEAIAILAGTITLTPGTVTADVSTRGQTLLVHCLDEPDPDACVRQIKHRYERRLKGIFG